MKIVKWIVGIVIAIPVLMFTTIYGASELSGEVITLDRKLEDGGVSSVRIWIVDQGEYAWIEQGDPSSYWITNLSNDPELTITRDGETATYRAMPDPASHDLYHSVRQAKYTWGDDVVNLFTGKNAGCSSVPVRIEKI